MAWVARDSDSCVMYVLTTRKPTLDDDGAWHLRTHARGSVASLPPGAFHDLFDLRLEPGECRKIDGPIHIPLKEG